MANAGLLIFVGNVPILNYYYPPAFEMSDSFNWPSADGTVITFDMDIDNFPLPPLSYQDILKGMSAKAELEKNTSTIIDADQLYEIDGFSIDFQSSYRYTSEGRSAVGFLRLFQPPEQSAGGITMFSYSYSIEPNYPNGYYGYGGIFPAYIKYKGSVRRVNIRAVNYSTDRNFFNVSILFSKTQLYTDIFGEYTQLDFPFTPVDPDAPIDPYSPSGSSSEGDLPPGTFDDSSDPISDSSLPTLSAANTGFTRIYNPTLAQVQQLAKYLWTDDTVIETIWNHIKQYFEDPMQAIIGFNLVPVPVPDGGTQSFALMYIDTGVEMTVASNQFVDVDCGTLAVERYYGSALDQSPYTKITCFLPYIGQVQLDTDEVMGTTLQVKYRVDIVTGSCVAKIFVDGNCLYQYTGHCAINIPISSADFSSYVSSAISIARLATTAGLAASGIVAPPTPVTTTQQTNKTTTTNTDTARNPATGRQITMGTHTTSVINETNKEVTTSQASFDGLSPQNISNTVGQIMGSKAIVQHSGSFSGNSGYLGVRRPYLIIERPNICLPANYQQLNGYPAMITMALSSCQGYTQVQQVQLTGLTATNPEQAEILSLLKGGVIF